MMDMFRSEEERFFYRMVRTLPQLVEDLRGYEVERVTYEGKAFHLGELKYTPDFNIVLAAGLPLIAYGAPVLRMLLNVEVKGSKKQRGYRDARTKLVTAASVFPEYVWLEVLVDARHATFEGFEIISKKPFVYLTQTTGV